MKCILPFLINKKPFIKEGKVTNGKVRQLPKKVTRLQKIELEQGEQM